MVEYLPKAGRLMKQKFSHGRLIRIPEKNNVQRFSGS
jgi:hypothetical protein